MKVQTHRFGALDVDEEDVIRFPEGLVGLSRLREFVLFVDPTSSDLYWLQSVEQATFAWALVHQSKLGSQFAFDWDLVDTAGLECSHPEECEVFVLLNRIEGKVTCNLQGPIIVNASRMIGKQVVLTAPQFSVRHPLKAAEEPALASV